MPSTFPDAPDDFTDPALTHGDVTDAVAAVQNYVINIGVGETGATGATGPAGPTGATGPAGPKGDTGDAGANGLNGLNGTNGADGADGADGVDGADGATGATGPAGPQGEPGADGADGGTGGGRLLSGSGAPASGSGLDPLDGVSNPWRWAPQIGAWVSEIREVTWVEGATIPAFETPAGMAELDVSVVLGPTLTAGAGSYSQVSGIMVEVVTTDAGSGIALLIQYEPGYAGPTTVPDATIDVADYLDAGFTIGAVYELTDVQTGVDGDFYRDLSAPAGTLKLYGPKAGTWPAPLTVVSDDQYTVPVLYSPLGNGFRLVVADDGTLATEPE